MAAICAACRLIERKQLLKEILKPDDVIRYSEHFADSGRGLLAAAKQQGLEGIVGKRAQSLYESRRSADWVKCKVIDSSDSSSFADSPRASAITSARWCWAFTTAAS